MGNISTITPGMEMNRKTPSIKQITPKPRKYNISSFEDILKKSLASPTVVSVGPGDDVKLGAGLGLHQFVGDDTGDGDVGVPFLDGLYLQG